MYIFKGIDERTVDRNMGTFSDYYFDCSRIDSFSINFLPEEMGCEPTYMGLKLFHPLLYIDISLCCEPTYMGLKQKPLAISLLLLLGCEPTYMGLKRFRCIRQNRYSELLRAYLYGIETKPGPEGGPVRFQLRAYLYGIETSILYMAEIEGLCCEPTYMGLKRGHHAKRPVFLQGCEPTYMGLKPFMARSINWSTLVASLPIWD